MIITVGIIEDQKETREMLATLVNSSEGFVCGAVYDNAEDAIRGLPEIAPDVILVDIHLPAQSGIECIRQLKTICSKSFFVMCTSLEDSSSIFSALEAGASGYLLKSTPSHKILEAITDVYNGGSPMSSTIARKVVASFARHDTRKNSELQKLTEREQEILHHLSKGYRYKEIADMLSIKIETVRKHIHNIYEKLQVASRTDALNKINDK
jgi:DNA-binding NarL/FixJ family response regulator